ncbi:MAG: Ig-like domain repeat protein, partial [Candidatus Contendobacter sp.]|nr:Ig-like domain repeat protein [Candidatus Contendobacter sp.]
VVITVTDAAGQTGQRSYAMRVETTVAVATPSLINGLTGAAYGQTLQAVGGTLPYAWSLLSGTLPAGVSLDLATGILSGIPTVAGVQIFTVQVTDNLGQIATQVLTLTIQAPSFTRPDPVDPGQPPISAALTVNPAAGATCAFNDQNSFTFNLGEHGVPVTGPAGIHFPNGLIQVVVEGCTPGETTLILTLVYPQPLPAGTQVWKYGPTIADPTTHWYVMDGVIIAGNTLTYSVRDGGLGDDDLLANGRITDPAGPGIPALTLNGTLPTTGQVGVAYKGTLIAVDGSSGPYVWSVAAGTLPPGVTLATTTQATTTVSGSPTEAGTTAFTVQVVDQGNGNTAAQQAFSVQIAGTQITPTVTLSAKPSAPAVNQATTLTATVTAPSGATGTPTGRVVFSGSGKSCTATLSNGTGSCDLNWASAGEVALTGAYGGDPNFTTASGTLTLSIGKVATATALTSTPNPSILGQPVTLTATVGSVSGTPSGTVAFQDGGTVLSGCGNVALTAGKATCTTKTLVVGSHPLSAVYSGSPTFAVSTGAVTQTVKPGTLIVTTTTLTSTPNPSILGQPVTLTATVGSVSGTPAGR